MSSAFIHPNQVEFKRRRTKSVAVRPRIGRETNYRDWDTLVGDPDLRSPRKEVRKAHANGGNGPQGKSYEDCGENTTTAGSTSNGQSSKSGVLDRLLSASTFIVPSKPMHSQPADKHETAQADDTAWQFKLKQQAMDDASADLDRIWYDCDESSGFNEQILQRNGYFEDSVYDQQREERVRLRQAQLGAKRGLTNLFQATRNREQELWEMTRMTQSGLSARQLGLPVAGVPVEAMYELPGTKLEGDDSVSHVIVREQYPPFLEGYGITSIRGTNLDSAGASLPAINANPEKITLQPAETVSVIKDPTADMAIMAKRGSAVIKQLRQMEDRSKMRQRFWEVGGSQMGNVIGVKDVQYTREEEEEAQQAADAMETPASSLKDRRNRTGANTFAKAMVSTEAPSGDSETSIKEQREGLPIFEVKEDLRQLVREHQAIVVVGETGSGKTTQLTQYFYEWGYSRHGRIGCTQPRRVATVSIAKRVSDEMGTELGTICGYSIRFEDFTSKATQIQYMTDGILLRESLTDPDLDLYSVLIMDEAHERSLNTDILFGVLRNVLARRHDLRLVVTSATLNAEKFSAFFGGCPIFHIPGRTYPVRVEYLRVPPADYVDAAVQKCLQIHCSGPYNESADNNEPGDILIFMTGQEDIEGTCYLVADRAAKLGEKIPPLTVLPIYSTLPTDLQARIFQRSAFRKVIVASNIAETSLTLNGIRYVIDSGYCKLKVFNAKMGMDSLQITPISRANAQQRAGRAGRTGPGVCFRLFTERAFAAEMFENTIPEIQRTSLCHTMLLLKSLGVRNVLEFQFMDPPPRETIVTSLYQLWVLNALNDEGDLTDLGKRMVQFPLDPPLAKMLLIAVELGCAAEILTIVSMLSVASVFYRPKDRAEESDAAREKFFVPESDHLTFLNAFQQWKKHSCSPQWAEAHFIHQKAMKKVWEVRQQLLDILTQHKLEHNSCGTHWDIVREAICAGFFTNGSKLRGIGEYVNLRTSAPCFLHASSALCGAGATPEYVVYHEVVLTTKEYMQHVTAVEPAWLEKWGEKFFQLKSSRGSTQPKPAADNLDKVLLPLGDRFSSNAVS